MKPNLFIRDLSMRFLVTLLIVALSVNGTARAQVPGLLSYQGRIVVGSTNFNGSGQFKFALVNTNGTTTYWSNDGTSSAGSQPTSFVTLNVSQGLYSLLLGDTTLANMTAIPTSVFSNTDVRLRVWFNDGANGFQLMSPDQRIAAVGYAIIAGGVVNGGITSSMISNGAVGSAQLASGAVGASQIAAGSITGSQLASNINLSGSLTAQNVTTSGNVSASGFTSATGPANEYIEFMGDSRFAGPQGVENNNFSKPLGYPDRVPALEQSLSYGLNTTCLNFAIAGTGLQTVLNNYYGTNFVTTGNVTAGSSTITVTGSVAGLPTGTNLTIGYPGVNGASGYATLTGTTLTLYSGIGGGTQNASTTTTGATIDLNTTLANTPDDETPHEMSYAISGVPSLVICAIGVNDGANSSFTGTTTSGSAVITGVSNANLFIAGYGLSGPGIPTGAVVGSTTASTVTMQVGGVNANATASGTSTLSLNVVESAWEAAYAKLINYALADGSKFICNTILPAPSWTSQSFRNDVNAWMLATYGTTALGNGAYSGTTPNVYVIDSATAFTGLLTSPGIYVDGVHLSAHGEQIWASSLNQGLATIFSSQMTGAPVTTTISVNAFGNLAAQSFDTWFGASSSVGATVEIGANNQYIGSNLQIGNLTFQSRGPINTPDFNFTGPNGNVLAEINPIPAGYFFADEPITTNNATTTVTFNAKGQNEFVYDKSTTTAYPTKTFVFPSLTTVGQTLEYTSTASISAITVSGGTFDDGSTFSSYTTGGPNAPVTVRWKATTTTGHFVREN